MPPSSSEQSSASCDNRSKVKITTLHCPNLTDNVRSFFLHFFADLVQSSFPCLVPLREKSRPRLDFVISGHFPFPSHIYPIISPLFSHSFPIISLYFTNNLNFSEQILIIPLKRKRRKKEISPYLLQSGLVMECCPEPWKCQERKGISEGEKEDGQWKKEGEKEEGRENEEICPLENI